MPLHTQPEKDTFWSITWDRWRRKELEDFIRRQLTVITIIACTFSFLRCIVGGTPPYYAGAVGICSLMLYFVVSHQCSERSQRTLCSFQTDLILIFNVAFPFVAIMRNSFHSSDMLLSNRLRWLSVQNSLAVLPANGFAPRRSFLWIGCAFIDFPLSKFGFTENEYSLAYGLMDLLTAVSSVAVLAFLRWCTHSQYVALQSAAQMMTCSKQFQMSGKILVESLFDASCTCSEQGDIIRSTAALDDLLQHCAPISATTRPQPRLSDFIDDPQRFLAYLKSSSSQRCTHAVPLHFTLRGHAEAIDASVLCVFLGESLLDGDCNAHESFFLGINVKLGVNPFRICPHTIEDTIVGKLAYGYHALSVKVEGVESQLLKRRMVFFSIMILCCFLIGFVADYLRIESMGCWICALISLAAACIGQSIVVYQNWQHREQPRMSVCGIGSERINQALQGIGRCAFEVALWFLAHHWVSVDFLTGWRFFTIVHSVMVYHVSPLMDFNWRQYSQFVGPVVATSGIYFGSIHGAVLITAVAADIFFCCVSAHFINSLQGTFNRTIVALRSQEKAQCELAIAQGAFTQMQHALFDATCHVDLQTHIVEDCSATFAWNWPPMVGVPILVMGARFEDRVKIKECIDGAVAANGNSVKVVHLDLATRELGACSAKLVAVLESFQAMRSSALVLVGIQLEESPMTDVGMIDIGMTWLDSIAEEITPGDSVSSCQETLVVDKNAGRLRFR